MSTSGGCCAAYRQLIEYQDVKLQQADPIRPGPR